MIIDSGCFRSDGKAFQEQNKNKLKGVGKTDEVGSFTVFGFSGYLHMRRNDFLKLTVSFHKLYSPNKVRL